MIQCLYPDCEHEESQASNDIEQYKRAIIDHINNTHDDAHVIIACAHDLTEIERFTAATRTPKGVPVEIPQVRFQCSRCGQFEVRSDEEGT